MKTVQLSKALKGGTVSSFSFRDPLFEDYMELGDPRAPIIAGDKVYHRPIPQTVSDYANRLLTNGEAAVMETASLRDAIAIQKVILDFFRDAESDETEKTTSSSSPGDASPSAPTRD